MSKFDDRFYETLREHLPREDHPNKELYTHDEIMREYEPFMAPIMECDEYGDTRCICGHDIKLIFRIYYKRKRSIIVEPVGSQCIKRFLLNDDVYYLKNMIDNTDHQVLWNGGYTTKHFKADNGFSKAGLRYLNRYDIITPKQFEVLEKVVNARKERDLDQDEITKLYGAIKNIQRAYNEHK